jgi:hypothetical protein
VCTQAGDEAGTAVVTRLRGALKGVRGAEISLASLAAAADAMQYSACVEALQGARQCLSEAVRYCYLSSTSAVTTASQALLVLLSLLLPLLPQLLLPLLQPCSIVLSW